MKTRISSILEKPKSTGLMVKAYATIKTRKKLSSASLRMDNSRAWGSCTLQAGIIISESSSSIRKMEEGFTSGQANNQIFTKANS